MRENIAYVNLSARSGLDVDGIDPDPLLQFGRWFEEAEKAGVFEPEAVALATAGADGAPSARMVLLKGFDERGFRFFTNYGSRKAAQLDQNPQAALLFHWKELGRQVRLEGPVERLSHAETVEYVRSRSRASQIGALASPQSRPIGSREELERRVEEVERRYEGQELPLPDDWGGYRLRPQVYELWQHGEHRLHDRLRYTAAEGGEWRLERLAP
jgi:pyridoxamine 5'-phosphate oxidase